METRAPEIHVLNHKVRLLQAENGFRTSMDSVFLAAACPARKDQRILDLGAGVGGASFCLLWRVSGCFVTGVEIQETHVTLARKNIDLNKMEGRADFLCTNIRTFSEKERFDHVICNPPYLEAGSYTLSTSKERAVALGHASPSPEEDADSGTLQDWIMAAFRNLKSGGTFTMIHRADMIDRILQGTGKKFGAVEIIPLYPRADEEAKRVIVRCIKDRKTPARIHAGIILHETDGTYTKAADAILRDGTGIA